MKIFKKPEELLQYVGIDHPSQIDLESISYFCGVEIEHDALNGCEAMLLGKGDKAIITVNSLSSIERQRFSIGHELGHWMLHRGDTAFFCEDKDLYNDYFEGREFNANNYASKLLMPAYLFLPYAFDIDATFSHLKQLTTLFNTSLLATTLRYVTLTNKRCALIKSTKNKNSIDWVKKSSNLEIFLHNQVQPDSGAMDVLYTKTPFTEKKIHGSTWFSHEKYAHLTMTEISWKGHDGVCYTLITKISS